MQKLRHLPTKPGDLRTADFNGRCLLDASGFDTNLYVSTCFLNFVKLYRLRAATTKACLNIIWNDYVVNVRRPKCILSDNGTRFDSKNWKNKLADMKRDVIFHPYVTRRPTEAKYLCGKLSSSAISTALRHIKDGQNYYRTFKVGSTERCQIRLVTVLLS